MGRMVVIGGGPAGMLAAWMLSAGHEVHLYDRHMNHGRKFLVAGEGGFNLTNELDGEALVQKYTPASFMAPVIAAFGSADLRRWLASMGMDTYTGSSGRVFPQRGIKPHEVLKAIKHALAERGVVFHGEHAFIGFDENMLPVLDHAGTKIVPQADHYFFGLGGASWPVTGSTGEWRQAFKEIGVATRAFEPSNCGVTIDAGDVLKVHEGKPLKNVAIGHGTNVLRGEAVITSYGLEGNAIYPLIAGVRNELNAGEVPVLHIDLKPDVPYAKLLQKLDDAATGERIAAAGLTRAQAALLKRYTSRDEFNDLRTLVAAIKGLQVGVKALRPLEEAISSVGGILLSEIDEDLRLCAHPHISVMGEMLDMDAPTGGFLLQSAFSTAYRATIAFG